MTKYHDEIIKTLRNDLSEGTNRFIDMLHESPGMLPFLLRLLKQGLAGIGIATVYDGGTLCLPDSNQEVVYKDWFEYCCKLHGMGIISFAIISNSGNGSLRLSMVVTEYGYTILSEYWSYIDEASRLVMEEAGESSPLPYERMFT